MSNYPHWNPWKFGLLFAITTLLLLLYGVAITAYHMEHPLNFKRADTMRIESQYVQAWFDRINEEYFNSSLPPTQVIAGKGPQGDIAIGETECVLSLTSLAPASCKIWVNPTYNIAGPTAVETVIHETCHVATYDEKDEATENHGPRWTECMLNLAKHGAFKGTW